MKPWATTREYKKLARALTLAYPLEIEGILKDTKLIGSLVHCVRGVAGYKYLLEYLEM